MDFFNFQSIKWIRCPCWYLIYSLKLLNCFWAFLFGGRFGSNSGPPLEFLGRLDPTVPPLNSSWFHPRTFTPRFAQTTAYFAISKYPLSRLAEYDLKFWLQLEFGQVRIVPKGEELTCYVEVRRQVGSRSFCPATALTMQGELPSWKFNRGRLLLSAAISRSWNLTNDSPVPS